MNLVVLHGNLARDPELKYFESNGKQTPYVNITVAVSRFYKKTDGSTVKDATFIPCEAYDSGAETISKLFKKGSPILVEGTLREYTWEKDGQKQYKMRVRINNFHKLERTPRDQSNDNFSPSEPSQSDAVKSETPQLEAVGVGNSNLNSNSIPF